MSPVNVLLAVLCNFVLLTRRLAVASPVYNMQPAFITANIGTVGRNIRHLPCVSRRSGTEGVCMFAIDCLKSNGTHLGTCIDRFYFGSCCRIDPSTMAAVTIDLIDNSIDGSSGGIPSLSSLKPSLLGMKPPTIPPKPNENIPFNKPTPSTINNTRKPISDDIIPSRKPILRPSATIKPQTTTEKFVTTQKVDTTTKRITTTQKPVVTTQKFVTSTERLTTKRLVSTTTKKTIVNTTRKPTQKPITKTTTTKPTTTTSKKPTVTTSKPITTQKINTTKTTSAPQISQSLNKTKPGIVKPIENEVVKPIAAASVLTTENPFKISTFQSVVDGSSIATTTSKPNLTTNKTNTTVTLKPTNKPVTNTTTKPKPTQKPSLKPTSQTSQKPISQQNQKPISAQNQKPVSQQNQKPVSQQTQKPVSQQNQKPVSQQNQKPVSQQNQRPVSQQNQKPVTQQTQKPVPQTNLRPVSSSTTTKPPVQTNKPALNTTTSKPFETAPIRNGTSKPAPIRTTPKPASTQKPKPTTDKIKTPTTTTSKPTRPTTEKPVKLTTVSFVSPSKVTTTLKPTPEVPALVPVQTFRPNLANPTSTTQATLTTTHIAVSSSEPVSTNEVDSETSANGELPGLVTWTTITEQTTQKTIVNSSTPVNTWTPVTTPDGWVLLPSVIPVSPKPLNATKKPTLSSSSTTTKKPLLTKPTDKPIKPSQKPPSILPSISSKPPPTTQNISSLLNQNVTKKPLPATTEKPLFNVTAQKPQPQKPIVFPDAFPSTGITTSRPPVTIEGAPKPPEEITLQPSAGITLKPQITSVKPEEPSTKNPPSETQDGFATTMKPGISTFIPIIGDAQTTSQMATDVTTSSTNISTTQQGDEEFTTLPPVDMTNYRQVCGRRMYPQARIVGGEKSTFGKWPWQISLRQWRTSTYLHKCGAALLNENWAITAAHCVDNVPPGDLLLRLGEHDLSSESEPHGFQERRVQIVASHPQFDPRTFEYDLALLRFYEPVAFQPNIIPVCVPENDEGFVGKTAYVTGWGRLYEDGPLPSVLQEVSVPVINNSVCEQMYRTAGYIEHIPNIFICAGWRRGGFDSCEGDSGGPMVIQRPDKRFLLAGVISWGIGCAEPNQPGVYTRISEFRDWINQILQF